jgi:1-acyl-sn-glycerol-3-phosphate acyltransferase
MLWADDVDACAHVRSDPTSFEGLNELRLLEVPYNAARATLSRAVEDLTRSAPRDPLADRDPDYIRATLPAYRRLINLYFRPKVRGLEHIPPEGPVLLVGNHSGGTLIADTFAFAFAFYTHFGPERAFYQLAHDLVLRLPAIAGGFRSYGTLAASHENAGHALDAGAAVLVYPGGDYESHRPSSESAAIDFGGRSGFVRLALDRGIPIVPVVAIGGQETALFLTRGEWAARTLRLDRLLRLKVLSLQLGPPFGVTVLDLPGRIPLPSQVTIEVLPSFDVRERFGRNPDEETVSEGITQEMQQALTALSEERDLPVVGKVGARVSGGVTEGFAQPWEDYDQMRVVEIAARLRRERAGTLELVRRYERSQKGRKMVLQAVEREERRRRSHGRKMDEHAES